MIFEQRVNTNEVYARLFCILAPSCALMVARHLKYDTFWCDCSMCRSDGMASSVYWKRCKSHPKNVTHWRRSSTFGIRGFDRENTLLYIEYFGRYLYERVPPTSNACPVPFLFFATISCAEFVAKLYSKDR